MKFELTILAPETIDEQGMDKLKKIIKEYATIEKFENAGVKRLAYDITLRGTTHERASYLYYDIEMAQGNAVKLSNHLNITDEALRYLLVKTLPQYAKKGE